MMLSSDRPRQMSAAISRKAGTIQSDGRRTAAAPRWAASWPDIGGKVPMRPWRCRLESRWSNRRRAASSGAGFNAAHRDSGVEGLIQLAALVQDGEMFDRVRQIDSRLGHAAVLSASGKTPWEHKRIYEGIGSNMRRLHPESRAVRLAFRLGLRSFAGRREEAGRGGVRR